MNDQEIVTELARLDCVTVEQQMDCPACFRRYPMQGTRHYYDTELEAWLDGPSYLTSRDAIVPLISKSLNVSGYDKLGRYLSEERLGYTSNSIDYAEGVVVLLNAEPRQLCIALLKAVGKWRD